MYQRIKDRVKEGRWEPEGGMWVEADCNLTSGESLVRQFQFGKRFFKEEDYIRLQPENDTMEPIIVPQDSPFSIVGRVIGLYRAFK